MARRSDVGGFGRLIGSIGWTSLVAAALGEVFLLAAWWRLGDAPAIAAATWIWPLTWVACVAGGLAVRPGHTPATGGGPLARHMLRELAAGALLVAVPLIVSLYGLAAMVIAWRAAR
ncbi:MAG: hypothetical protein QF733_00600 [Phycisphaerales bacterium]|nr:hypothetical protein [Phycisphaerales bacterium]